MIMFSAAIVVWLTPRRIWRKPALQRTRKNNCHLVAPDIRPLSMISDGTLRKPTMVFFTMGGNAKMIPAMRPTTGPKPKRIRMGRR